jgi:hypothetical protein
MFFYLKKNNMFFFFQKKSIKKIKIFFYGNARAAAINFSKFGVPQPFFNFFLIYLYN